MEVVVEIQRTEKLTQEYMFIISIYIIRYVEQFLRHIEIDFLTKLRALLAGTMIFELAVKNDTESICS